jgi:hypothetical protein
MSPKKTGHYSLVTTISLVCSLPGGGYKGGRIQGKPLIIKQTAGIGEKELYQSPKITAKKTATSKIVRA